MSYVNDGKQGNTWAVLTATILGAESRWMTVREIADVIWDDPMTTPLDVRQTVNSSIDKLIRAGYVESRKAPKESHSSFEYSLNTLGLQQFEPQPGFKASEHSDSKIFTRPAKPVRKSKKVIRFNKKRYLRQRRTA